MVIRLHSVSPYRLHCILNLNLYTQNVIEYVCNVLFSTGAQRIYTMLGGYGWGGQLAHGLDRKLMF